MRQVGVLAAAGIVALTEMVDRLEDDHIRAKRLSTAIAELPGVTLNPDHIDTNIIIFGFDHPRYSITEFLEALKAGGVLALATRGGIRFVTHNDISDEDIEKAISVFQNTLL